MKFAIRPYHSSDLVMLYRICLLTGNSGSDASDLYKDPDILGNFYAAPYAVLEPELCFVVTCSNKPCGYIVGTRDSEKFSQRCEIEWFPRLREGYPLSMADDNSYDARIIRLIHEGYTLKDELKSYPAHLHINLLPEIQGQGFGRKLIEIFTFKKKLSLKYRIDCLTR